MTGDNTPILALGKEEEEREEGVSCVEEKKMKKKRNVFDSTIIDLDGGDRLVCALFLSTIESPHNLLHNGALQLLHLLAEDKMCVECLPSFLLPHLLDLLFQANAFPSLPTLFTAEARGDLLISFAESLLLKKKREEEEEADEEKQDLAKEEEEELGGVVVDGADICMALPYMQEGSRGLPKLLPLVLHILQRVLSSSVHSYADFSYLASSLRYSIALPTPLPPPLPPLSHPTSANGLLLLPYLNHLQASPSSSFFSPSSSSSPPWISSSSSRSHSYGERERKRKRRRSRMSLLSSCWNPCELLLRQFAKTCAAICFDESRRLLSSLSNSFSSSSSSLSFSCLSHSSLLFPSSSSSCDTSSDVASSMVEHRRSQSIRLLQNGILFSLYEVSRQLEDSEASSFQTSRSLLRKREEHTKNKEEIEKEETKTEETTIGGMYGYERLEKKKKMPPSLVARGFSETMDRPEGRAFEEEERMKEKTNQEDEEEEDEEEERRDYLLSELRILDRYLNTLSSRGFLCFDSVLSCLQSCPSPSPFHPPRTLVSLLSFYLTSLLSHLRPSHSDTPRHVEARQLAETEGSRKKEKEEEERRSRRKIAMRDTTIDANVHEQDKEKLQEQDWSFHSSSSSSYHDVETSVDLPLLLNLLHAVSELMILKDQENRGDCGTVSPFSSFPLTLLLLVVYTNLLPIL
ncbi:hypothetical protein CSUI_003750, partial [Cystoisospora suis]